MDQEVLVLAIDLEEPANKLLGVGPRATEGRKVPKRNADAQ
jgi:hypothetical protein